MEYYIDTLKNIYFISIRNLIYFLAQDPYLFLIHEIKLMVEVTISELNWKYNLFIIYLPSIFKPFQKEYSWNFKEITLWI